MEELLKNTDATAELKDEELEQVSGGAATTGFYCLDCKRYVAEKDTKSRGLRSDRSLGRKHIGCGGVVIKA